MSLQFFKRRRVLAGAMLICSVWALTAGCGNALAQAAGNWTDILGESSGVNRSFSSGETQGGSGTGVPDITAGSTHVELQGVDMEVLEMQSNLASDFSSVTDFNSTMASTFTTSASGVMAVAANRGASSSGGGGGEDLVD